MTLLEFGTRVGIDFTYASRLKNGKRLPSAYVMDRIAAEFNISAKALLEAHSDGPEAFGELLRTRVFKEGAPAA